MALTFAQGLVILQARIGDSSNSTAATQALNAAQRDAARRHPWPELRTRAFVSTVAAYSTGTVAVSNGGTTWTLTGGTYPTDVATGKYRIALGVNKPWHTIITRTSGAAVETTGMTFLGTTVTASTYVAYKSHYSLASDVDRVEEVWLHDNSGGARQLFNAATDQKVTDFMHFPSGPGIPTHYMNIERDASGYRQILVGPETPNGTYRLEYVYRKQLTDGTLGLDDSRWPAVLAKACAILYEPEYYERHVAALREYEALIEEQWTDENESETEYVHVGQGRLDAPGVPSLGMRDDGTTITGRFF